MNVFWFVAFADQVLIRIDVTSVTRQVCQPLPFVTLQRLKALKLADESIRHVLFPSLPSQPPSQ
jgi:hypothetical protein